MSTLTAPSHAPVEAPRPVRRPGPRPVGRPTTGTRPSHLRVVGVEERPRPQARPHLSPRMGVVLTALLFIVLFAVAGAQSLLVQGQLRLDNVDKQLRAEQARYQELRKDLAEKESPERVVAAAHEQGMVTPLDLVYLQPTDADRPEHDGDSNLARSSDRDWSSVKPLLETPEP